ncbi:FRG domain-containing protein [Shewanella chilikensis]|uniref:FRG domain-containing protein n=1 Tax=Shewanella chilikensis TaxID=558541 RepID=UPI0030055C30
MARTKMWEEGELVDGVLNVEISSWKYFPNYINKEMLEYTDYVYRGHGDSNWKLEPTLDRVIKSPRSPKRDEHLLAFKYETRGRRGRNPSLLEDDNDWWALGQHHGLMTPLLDWSASPFVALFFAASKAIELKTDSFTVFAIWQNGIEAANENIKEEPSIIKQQRHPLLAVRGKDRTAISF